MYADFDVAILSVNKMCLQNESDSISLPSSLRKTSTKMSRIDRLRDLELKMVCTHINNDTLCGF